MNSADREEMQKIDSLSIEKYQIPSIVLVEHAAMAVVKNINLRQRDTFAIFVGIGNNGADGLAVARILLSYDKKVNIYVLGNIDKASDEFKIEYNILRKLNANIKGIETIYDLEKLDYELEKVNTIIDAIFGTGLNREVKNIYYYVIELLNKKRIYKISVDIPSGLDASSGEILATAVDSDLIVCMQLVKKGILKNNWFKDKFVVENISMPLEAIREVL
ncbi:MAG: NAD(P)H-hydrate epimerase [Tissierellia bacterium]|nr:NAD(P)H-hydrate epimerase [Tissierellia bacterium]